MAEGGMMSEEWRRKQYYGPRVMVWTDDILDSGFDDCLVCLTGGQLNLVRNLLQYAHRRSTFVSEYSDLYYLAPTNDEWDAIQAAVAQLEGNLMNCEQFTQDLAEMLARLRAIQGLGCIPPVEGASEYFPYSDETDDDEIPYVSDPVRCAKAQLWFEWGYQVITEQVLPASRWGFDWLIPALAAFIFTAVGGPAAGAGIWVIAEAVQELLEIPYIGAETNLINWMTTNKHDIVCKLYWGLVTTENASTIWQAVYDAEIAPAEDISAGDKIILNLFMGTWAGSNAHRAYENATDWAVDNVIPGYCSDCGSPPLVYEWTLPPHTGWRLTDTHSEWTVEGWGHFWQGNGGLASSTITDIPYGDYTWVAQYHLKGSDKTPDHKVLLRQKDTDGPWFVAPVYDTTHQPGTGSPDEWLNLEESGTVTVAHPYLVFHIYSSQDFDYTGCLLDYVKLTLTEV
jgi:hypothetical protein